MEELWDGYPDLMDDLQNVKDVMKNSIKTNEKYIEKPLLDLINSGGKMLRPAFLILSSKFGDFDEKKIYNLAAIIEMLHMATLIHDDIIDESKLRRGIDTIQSKYGKDYAVYMGDYLFSKCFIMLSDDYEYENLKKLSQAISKICMGEIRQYYFRYRSDVSLRRYLKIISGKTASLFALSFYIGAKESNCNKKINNRLGKIGYNIGMAFQIIDDILDYTADETIVGKNIKNDIKQGFLTLPIIYSLLDGNDRLKELISKEDITYEDIKEVINLVKKSNGIKKSRELAIKYTNRAFEKINELPQIESKNTIKDITTKLLRRDY